LQLRISKWVGALSRPATRQTALWTVGQTHRLHASSSSSAYHRDLGLSSRRASPAAQTTLARRRESHCSRAADECVSGQSVRECVSACVSERVTCLRRSSSSRAFTIASASALSLETNQSQFERKQRNKRSALGRELVELADQCLSVTRRRHRTIHRHSACTCIDIDIDICSCNSRVDRSVCVNGSRQQRQLCHVGIVVGNASQEHIVIGIVD
jgi:hypothetical protein